MDCRCEGKEVCFMVKFPRASAKARRSLGILLLFVCLAIPAFFLIQILSHFVSSAAPMVTWALLKARGEAEITASLCSQKHSPLTPFPDILHIYTLVFNIG